MAKKKRRQVRRPRPSKGAAAVPPVEAAPEEANEGDSGTDETSDSEPPESSEVEKDVNHDESDESDESDGTDGTDGTDGESELNESAEAEPVEAEPAEAELTEETADSGEADVVSDSHADGSDERDDSEAHDGEDQGPSLVGEGVEFDESEVEDTEHYLKGLVESLLFSSDKPQTARDIARAAKIDKGRVQELIEVLVEETKDRGVRLVEVSEGYAFRTNPAYSSYVREYLAQRPVRLSRAQLETLAIVAYRQPITRPEVDDIRGVDSGAVLKTLLERELVRILGKKDEPGRPMIYGTTPGFLDLFSLKSLRDLPTLREFTELSEDSRAKFEMEIGEPAPEGPIEFPEEDSEGGGDSEAEAEVPADGSDAEVADDDGASGHEESGESTDATEDDGASGDGDPGTSDDDEPEGGRDLSDDETEDDGADDDEDGSPQLNQADEEEFPDDEDDDDDEDDGDEDEDEDEDDKD